MVYRCHLDGRRFTCRFVLGMLVPQVAFKMHVVPGPFFFLFFCRAVAASERTFTFEEIFFFFFYRARLHTYAKCLLGVFWGRCLAYAGFKLSS